MDATIMKKNKGMAKSKSQKIVFGVMSGIFALYSFSLLAPFVWILINSFKDTSSFMESAINGGGMSFPKTWHLKNYYDALIGFKISVEVFSLFINLCFYLREDRNFLANKHKIIAEREIF